MKKEEGLEPLRGPMVRVLQGLLEKCVKAGGVPPTQAMLREMQAMGVVVPGELWSKHGPADEKEGVVR